MALWQPINVCRAVGESGLLIQVRCVIIWASLSNSSSEEVCIAFA